MVSRSDLDEIQEQLKISIQNHQVSEPCQLFGAYLVVCRTSEKLSKKIKCECLQIVYSNNFIVKHIMGYSVQICMFLGVFRKEFYVHEINRSCR